MIALTCIAVPIVLFVCTVVPLSDRGGFRSFFYYMLFLSCLLWLATGGASARIDMNDREVRFINLFTVARVPLGEISGVHGANGVVVRAAGRRYESFAYGSSFLQRFFPSRRYRMVAERIQRGLCSSASTSQPRAPFLARPLEIRPEGRAKHRSKSRAGISARKFLVVGFPCFVAVTQVYGVILWRFADVLRPIAEGL